MACIFCGSVVDKTDEHVYARWMRRGLNATGPTRVTVGPDQRFVRMDTGPTIILRKGVCGDCNSGWMSTLEKRLQKWLLPAMRGHPMAYAPETQREVSAWAVQKALLVHLVMGQWGQPSFAPVSCIQWLYEHRSSAVPPPGTQVWLAAVDAQLGTKDALTGSITVGWARRKPADIPQHYFATFSAGYLVIQVAGQDFRGADEPLYKTHKGESLVTFARPDSLLTSLVSIWPERDGLVTWPPRTRMTNDELTHLGEWAGTDFISDDRRWR